MEKIYRTLKSFVGLLFLVFVLISIGVVIGRFQTETKGTLFISQPSILELSLEGVIIDGKTFLEDLRKYAKEDRIKGILVRVNSPGGVVGPSQEIYAALQEVRNRYKKPVVVTCLSIAASGAYYVASAADQIFTNPGTLMGSIGVIMEFANLEKLYKWAKVERYAIKTGTYKDSGAEYRPMRPDEKALFQKLANNVLEQFKRAVKKGRQKRLSWEVLNKNADGRIFTGEEAVNMGFADQIGTYGDALRFIGKLTGLGDNPEVFIPPKSKNGRFLRYFLEEESSFRETVEKVLNLKTLGYPLYIFPGALGL